jgi:hypothetical protein
MVELAPLFTSFTDVSSTITFTNLTKGNATIDARYVKIGRLVIYWGQLIFGSTTSITGSVRIGLPITAGTGKTAIGVVSCGDVATRDYVGTLILLTTTTAYPTHSESGNLGSVDATNPMTWTTGDLLRWFMAYEAAS